MVKCDLCGMREAKYRSFGGTRLCKECADETGLVCGPRNAIGPDGLLLGVVLGPNKEIETKRLKSPDLSVFIEVLRTLADQGAIDVEPQEGKYDLTRIYDWLVSSFLASRSSGGPYWLNLANGEACEGLAALLEYLRPKFDGEARADQMSKILEGEL